MESALAAPQNVADSVLQYIDNSATIRSCLQLKIPTLIALAAKNFDVSAQTGLVCVCFRKAELITDECRSRDNEPQRNGLNVRISILA